MATIEEILAGTDTRGFGTNLTSDPSQVFSSPFTSRVNQNIINSGILQTDQAQNTLNQLPVDPGLPITPMEFNEEPQSRGIFDLIKSGAGRVKDTFLQGIGAQGGLNIGARLGMMINPALAIPFALGGAFLGAKGIREATPGERGIQSLYGGPNTIQQGAKFIDPETGEEVDSLMAGYNISSMFGKGIPAAIDKRIARIDRTLQKKQSDTLKQRREALLREKAAVEAAELAAQRRAVDDMFARGEGGSGQDFTGGRFDGASSREEYDANPTGFSGSS